MSMKWVKGQGTVQKSHCTTVPGLLGLGGWRSFPQQQQDRDPNLRNQIPITPRTEGGPFFPPGHNLFEL